jgi:hypothetical protein
MVGEEREGESKGGLGSREAGREQGRELW